MKLMQLKDYVENDYDKTIISRMVKDSEENLNNYIISVISDLINTILIEEKLKIATKNNIYSYDDKLIGEISLYVSLIPYLQLQLKERKDGYIVVTSFIEILISYIIGHINEKEFDKKICEMKAILKISNQFYDYLLKYFTSKNEEIKNGLSQRI